MKSKKRAYLALVLHSEHLLPHSEHPSAYAEADIRRRVKFLQSHGLLVYRLDAYSPGRSGSSMISGSPPDSIKSLLGSVASKSQGIPGVESQHVEFDFEDDSGKQSLSYWDSILN